MNLANVLTMTRMGLIPVFVGLYYIDSPMRAYFMAGVFVLASATDWMDGWIARKHDMVTDFGRFMDPIADKLLMLAAVIILVERQLIAPWLAIIIIGREIVMSGFRLVAASKGKVISAGIWGKLKTITQFIALTLMLLGLTNLLAFDYTLLAFDYTQMNYLLSLCHVIGLYILYISTILSVISCVDYIVRNREILKVEEK